MSQAAELRAHKPAMLKDRDSVWEDPLELEGELSEENAWCATPRRASRRTT